jgi:hypothetical protein
MGFLKAFLILGVLALIVGGFFYYTGTGMTKKTEKVSFTREENGITMTFVSGTEYYYGDLGKTIIQILNVNQHKLNGTCNQTILYHNGSVFLTGNLPYLDSSGNEYAFFVIPNVSGVYTVNVDCYVPIVNRNMSSSKTFHVSNATSKILEVVRQNASTLLMNIQNNINLTNTVLTITNDTNYYLKGHVNDHLHNISSNLTVIADNTQILIHFANQTYNLVYNNITQGCKQVINISKTINTTTINNAYSLELIKEFLGVKPFNITVKVTQNELVIKNQMWLVQAEVRDQYSRIVSNATCSLSSPIVGVAIMNYIPSIYRYEYQKKMNATGTIPFSVTCTA